MKNNHFKSITFLYAACCATTMAAKSPITERPNFVWFMAEDVSAHYLRLYNDQEKVVVTPHIEKLAKEGIIFNNA